MMRGVTGVVKDSLDRADAWVERLRVVGLQRNSSDGVGVGNGRSVQDSDGHGWVKEEAPKYDWHQRAGPEGDENADALRTRSHSYSSSTLSSMSSVPSTPYSAPGTPAPGPLDVPSPVVVTGIAGLSLGMVANGGEFGVDARRSTPQHKGRQGEDVVEMEIDE
jgi:hypothetical protein